MGNALIAVVGYGAALSLAFASALGFFGALTTKPKSVSERLAIGWWLGGAALSVLFAAMTRGLLGGCAP